MTFQENDGFRTAFNCSGELKKNQQNSVGPADSEDDQPGDLSALHMQTAKTLIRPATITTDQDLCCPLIILI